MASRLHHSATVKFLPAHTRNKRTNSHPLAAAPPWNLATARGRSEGGGRSQGVRGAGTLAGSRPFGLRCRVQGGELLADSGPVKGAGTPVLVVLVFPNFELQKSSPLFHGAGIAPVPPDWLLVLAPYRGSYPLLCLGFTRSARREEGRGWGGVGREFSGKKKVEKST